MAAFVLSRLKVFLFLLSPKSGNPLVKKQSLPILKSTGPAASEEKIISLNSIIDADEIKQQVINILDKNAITHR